MDCCPGALGGADGIPPRPAWPWTPPMACWPDSDCPGPACPGPACPGPDCPGPDCPGMPPGCAGPPGWRWPGPGFRCGSETPGCACRAEAAGRFCALCGGEP